MSKRDAFSAALQGIATDESARRLRTMGAGVSRLAAICATADLGTLSARPATASRFTKRDDDGAAEQSGDPSHADEAAAGSHARARGDACDGSEALGYLQESLLALAGTAPAARAHLQPVITTIVLAWHRYSEATASAMGGGARADSQRPMEGDHEYEVPLPGRWAIATLDRLSAEDPLWACKIALLRAWLTVDSAQPQVSGNGRPLPTQRRSVEWTGCGGAGDALPLPFGGEARAFREQLGHQLRSHATSAIIESLFAADALLSPAERPLACWIPCLLSLQAMHRDGEPDPYATVLLDFIGENARQQLSRLPPTIATTWLVGRDPYERCAARLLALLFMRRGVACYPWTSEAPPEFGRYLVAGMGAAGAVDGLPGNCLGVADLVAEAQRNHDLAQAASLWGSDGAGTPFTAADDGWQRSQTDEHTDDAACGVPAAACSARGTHD
jgi:hypothetical protein